MMEEKINSKIVSMSKGVLEIKLPSDEVFYVKDLRSTTKGKKYVVSTEVSGIKGAEFSALFGVAVPYQKVKIKDQKIRWLNDFSGSKKKISIVFRASDDNLIIFYRFNAKTPVRSPCHYQVLLVKKVKLEEAEPETKEEFDDHEKFFVPPPTQLTVEQENELEKNLVWIFASPRSGTTWLGTRLLKEQFLRVDEPKIGSHLGFPLLLEKSLQEEDNKKRQDYFFSNEFKDTWKHYLRKLILNRIYAQLRDTSKKIVIKEPNGSIGADFIVECLPTSKIIILLRDGRDIVDSLVDAFSENGWLAKRGGVSLSVNDRLEFIKQQSKRWTDLVKILMKVYENHPKQNLILIRYEDLKEETFEVLKSIYKFLDFKIDDNKIKEIVEKYSYKNIPSELKGKGKAIRSATPGKWKEDFGEEEKKTMNEIMKDALSALGYE